ncbi:UbiA family prenyltransferase [Flavobacteriales bacterium]|nr:UbiA family prenyltransferase [Flavobacteriales bacterium]
MSTEILLDINGNYKISQFVFFATLFAYNFQRIVRIKKGKNHVRKEWLHRHKIAIYSLMFLGGLMSASLFFEFQRPTQIAIVVSGSLSFGYPFLLRKIPGIKIFIIVLVWTISTMLLVLLENQIQLSQNITLHLFARFLLIFAITIPFDIRDLNFDNKELRTIPIVFGSVKARIIAISALVLCTIIAVVQYINKDINVAYLLALILLYFVSLIFIAKSDVSKREMYFSFWIESLSILGYIFLIISALIF